MRKKFETIRDSLSLHYNFKPDMCTYQSMEINTAFDHEIPQSRDVRAAAETCGRCDGARNHHVSRHAGVLGFDSVNLACQKWNV